uniref:Carcinustatin-15 n=1 Tax=Carcinus maenas TaxID=6759 RepID=ALL15_CARMA|nr:RecName: Full=Carcinustatin-15 [Carcinus maenas]
AGPYSFGL